MNAIHVQYMNKDKDNQDHFNLMREIQKRPKTHKGIWQNSLDLALENLIIV